MLLSVRIIWGVDKDTEGAGARKERQWNPPVEISFELLGSVAYVEISPLTSTLEFSESSQMSSAWSEPNCESLVGS